MSGSDFPSVTTQDNLDSLSGQGDNLENQMQDVPGVGNIGGVGVGEDVGEETVTYNAPEYSSAYEQAYTQTMDGEDQVDVGRRDEQMDITQARAFHTRAAGTGFNEPRDINFSQWQEQNVEMGGAHMGARQHTGGQGDRESDYYISGPKQKADKKRLPFQE